MSFRRAAREVCSSLRRVLPLVRSGGAGDSRRRDRMQRARLNMRRRARVSMTLAPSDDLAALLADISGAVSGRAAGDAAALQADFAGRMAGAIRTAPRHLVAAILQGLKIELSQLVAAIMQQAAAEIQARQQALIQERGKAPGSPADNDEAQRPAAGVSSPAAVLAR